MQNYIPFQIRLIITSLCCVIACSSPFDEAEKRYDYSYEQPIHKETAAYAEPITNTEPTEVTEQPVAESCSETVHSEEKKVRGYYLNGVFHPYTDEELKELEKNGY